MYIAKYSPVESVIAPVAVSLSPTVIAGPSDDGTSNAKLKVSDPSAILSLITGTLTLLIITPAAKVAVSVVVLKSTSPVSQTIFSQHTIKFNNTPIIYLQQILVTVLMV